MFRKVLVANRGEIAIRAFRAGYELGARTVAVFPHEDRNSLHRLKADEAYEIGEPGHPVRAYLSVEEIVEATRQAGADAVYPGYGFLSENPDLARACEEAGITFVGPSAETLELTGNKARAVAAARAAGVPVLGSSEPSSDVDELVRAAEELGFPVFVKAVAGGGGRGMRRVEEPRLLRESIEAAAREAESAFGDPTVFLEKAVVEPRHIEVQILADAEGNVMHLFERDCSLQRRHQKVIEMAPAPHLDPELRERICGDAVKFAREIGYRNAGTVEFLLDRDGNHVFIEMNPRIQVEHTVTEEITDVDLVQSQMRIASGETLPDLGLSQETVYLRGAALQCRITTEDPANGFRPDIGMISAYRSPGGSGIRLDGGTTHAGAEISAHFDSMLVKLTCRGRDFDHAIGRARRAVAEFRIRGVSTNVPFLQAVLDDPDFRAGNVTTSFIEERPHLLTARHSADRGTKLLTYLADTTVNKPHGPRPQLIDASGKLPQVPGGAPPAGSKQTLTELGPEGFARWLRESPRIGVTDTTFRDAHQSLLATRVRTKDLLAVAPAVAHTVPQLLSLECWGGATYDVALRFLAEDPWERLAALREAVPNICLQMLLRGRNTVGYTPYPTEVTDAFVHEATATGIDIFRIFDALNDIGQMRPAIEAVRDTGTAVAEVALCYTSDLSDPSEKLYTLDYYLRLAEQIVDAGAHVLAIKDMAGLLRAPAAAKLVSALRREFDLPVHLHTHDTAGGQLATYLAAIQAGADAVDGAVASMAGTTSQPSLSAIVAATDHSERPTGLDLEAIGGLEPYWESVRKIYAPFEAGLASPTGRVYHHEIPGGQLSNLRTQAIALGLGDRFEDIEAMYAAADRMLGHLVKVTPSSKVVGDLALHLVGAGVSPEDFKAEPNKFDIPDSVIGFLRGELGNPPGGWPEPFRTKALEGRAEAKPTTEELSAEDRQHLADDRRRTLNRLLFPGPTKEFETHRETFGDTSVLDSKDFFYGIRPGKEYAVDLEPGVRLLIELEAIGEADERGMRTVMSTLNGQLRPIQVRDTSAASDIPATEKADKSNPGHVAAPFAGVVTLTVAEGDQVEAGATVATIEAMKMEATIAAPKAGRVSRVAINTIQQVEGGDLLVDLG
ncbi:pyruvate carboxylase [Streptomyces himastatinicus ATCC 53653]|uniref:Pyruvate carboxylase n=1 Tax=Streptomyces himastatinicus ATCC 53653 TaxID=457427 RepID=D9WV12_9ACTN|nr:pyruvate carboxylase [Streptomyces himastatinicus]EFL28512.1 pyruvate carboxylase [Streptomyces himastatinicus ATCC 53653]